MCCGGARARSMWMGAGLKRMIGYNLLQQLQDLATTPIIELGTGRIYQNDKGRWPANVVHDGSDEVVQGFPDTTSGDLTSYQRANRDGYVGPMPAETNFERNGDSGSAARFFYTAKADGDERIGSKHPPLSPST